MPHSLSPKRRNQETRLYVALSTSTKRFSDHEQTLIVRCPGGVGKVGEDGLPFR